MRMRLTVIVTLVVLLCVSSFSICVSAEQRIDMDRLGSLSVVIMDTETEQGVSGGNIDIYRVADAAFDPYVGYAYQYTSDFSACKDDLKKLDLLSGSDNAELAAKWQKYAAENKIDALHNAEPNQNGECSFSNLSLGVYLVVQTEAGKDHSSISPFIITIPQKINGEYIYDVDAMPKAGTSDYIPPEETTPSEPTAPTTQPTSPSDNDLPHTGQPWLPVYLLLSAGVICIVIGIVSKRNKYHG